MLVCLYFSFVRIKSIKVIKDYDFEIRLVGRSVIGKHFRDKDSSIVKSRDKGYFEIGVEFNGFFEKLRQGLGLGFNYRLGEYVSPNAIDNLDIRKN